MVPNFCSFQLHWEWPSQWLLVFSLRIVKSPRTWRHNIYRVTEAAPYISALVSTEGQVMPLTQLLCLCFLTINGFALIQPSESTLAVTVLHIFEVCYVMPTQKKKKEKQSKQKKIKSMPIPVKYKSPLCLSDDKASLVLHQPFLLAIFLKKCVGMKGWEKKKNRLLLTSSRPFGHCKSPRETKW